MDTSDIGRDYASALENLNVNCVSAETRLVVEVGRRLGVDDASVLINLALQADLDEVELCGKISMQSMTKLFKNMN